MEPEGSLHRLHKCPPLAPIESQMNQVHALALYLIIHSYTSRYLLWSLLEMIKIL